MPKHAYKFPPEVVSAIKRHVQAAIDAVAPERYKQEANYTAALLARLEGTAYEGKHGRIVFTATVVDDRGPRSAESRYGADYAITATVSDGTTTVNKAILVQVKLGRVRDLTREGEKFLKDQIGKMPNVVPAPKVMEIPEEKGRRYPAVISGNRILEDADYRATPLPEYFVSRVTTTLDGCTDPDVVEAVKESSLARLDVLAKLRT